MIDIASFDRDGYTLLRGVFSAAECDLLVAEWQQVADENRGGVLRNADGQVYGGRNLLELWPAVARLARQPPLAEALSKLLGAAHGLVRVLFFDKPPDASWALPWHKDLTIAVRDNTLSSSEFNHPTRKNGLPHVEAPAWLLERMLTARVHLDDVTEENGPLRVLPGSHRSGKSIGDGVANPVSVLCRRGDVLLMRPLVAHSSGHSAPGTTRHRRIVHLEFAGVRELPDGYEWQDFVDG